MYTTLRGFRAGPDESGEKDRDRSGETRRRMPRIVIALGAVSFFTDLSSEMVIAVLPVYLTVVLGLSPLQYGVVDGVYQGATAAVRLLGGLAADLTRRPKMVAVIGYGLSCGCKLGLLP